MSDEMRHQSRLAGGVVSCLPLGCLLTSGRGGVVYDEHGREYTDLSMGYGAVSIGHGETEIAESVCDQAFMGTLLPGATKVENDARAALHDLFPHTCRASLHKTGSEAVAAAIRIARSSTNRQLIVRCGFHGWHDELIQLPRRWHEAGPSEITGATGVSGVRDGSPPLEWFGADLGALNDILTEHSQEVAAVILDPVQIRSQFRETLSSVRDLCRQSKTLFILDELKTCPRVAMGGVQEAYGVTSDLTVVGKGLANGFAFAAVLGPEWLPDACRVSRIMGTFNGELTALSAVSATIGLLQREDAPRRLAALGTRMIVRTNELLDERQLNTRARLIAGPWPCMPQLKMLAPSVSDNFGRFTAEHGACVLFPHMNFICLRHTLEDLDRAALAITAAVAKV